MNYVVISPVKDEERYVERTLQSMARQTVKPVRWIIVDDGSSDRTPALIERFQRDHSFVRIVTRPAGQARQPGSAVIGAFNLGYDHAREVDHDFVVKLDCDLSFEADYFEKLLSEFSADPKLGIASGVYLEAPDGETWREIAMPAYHAAGASKVMRRTCFDQIGGFIAARGWDTVDEIRALARGWRTGHFRGLKMKHWKLEGSGIGPLRTSLMHGEIYYRTGGSGFFFVLKLLHRTLRRPLIFGGLAMFWGYARSMARRERLVTADEARCYRALLHDRILGRLKGLFQPSQSRA